MSGGRGGSRSEFLSPNTETAAAEREKITISTIPQTYWAIEIADQIVLKTNYVDSLAFVHRRHDPAATPTPGPTARRTARVRASGRCAGLMSETAPGTDQLAEESVEDVDDP